MGEIHETAIVETDLGPVQRRDQLTHVEALQGVLHILAVRLLVPGKSGIVVPIIYVGAAIDVDVLVPGLRARAERSRCEREQSARDRVFAALQDSVAVPDLARDRKSVV